MGIDLSPAVFHGNNLRKNDLNKSQKKYNIIDHTIELRCGYQNILEAYYIVNFFGHLIKDNKSKK